MTIHPDDDALLWSGLMNSFQFVPEIPHDDLLEVARYSQTLGYKLLLREVGLRHDEIVAKLRADGPGHFLRKVRLQEDVVGRASTESVSDQIAARLTSLSAISELIITDPYLFPSSAERDIENYSETAARLITPLLDGGARLTAVIDPKSTSSRVQEAVIGRIKETHVDLRWSVKLTNRFHDRFWIADRERGVIMGTSLNKVGSKVFFMDSLTSDDVAAVVTEIEEIDS